MAEEHGNERIVLNSTDFTGLDDLRDLIALCLKDDRKAQKQLYDRYAPQIYATIRRYIVQPELAQEVLNDTFFKVFTRLSSYAFQGAFEGWMRRIAVNLITDHFRRNVRQEPAVKVEVEEYHAYINSDSLGKIAVRELLGVIHTLPDTQRAVFNLTIFEGMSHKETAQLLGITENNSRWHLNDARRRLKEKLSSIM